MASALVLQPVDPRFPPSLRDALEDDIEIYLTISANSTVTLLKLCSSDTIASVKMRIQACEGFYVKHQRLVYGGRELSRQDARIRDYGVTSGKMLHLILKLSELQVVTIMTGSGKEYAFRIDRMNCVRDLKQRLSERGAGLSSHEQELVLKGKDLQDEIRIEQLPLEDDASVHLFLRSTVKVRSHAIGGQLELSVTAPGRKVEQSVTRVKGENAANLRSLLPMRYSESKIDHFYSRKESYRLEAPAPIDGLSTLNGPSMLLDLIQQVRAGLEQGHSPILSPEGSGGAYFMQDELGVNIIGVFKPMDEEPMAVNNPRGLPVSRKGEGLKRGTKVGKGALREVAAYLLDHPASSQGHGKLKGFAGVPPTVIIKCFHQAFYYSKSNGALPIKDKVGSLQLFVHSVSNCEDMGPACFPLHEVHKIAVLDMRLANTDRNGANILVCKQADSAGWSLVPIDHGYCLPDKFEDCTFEWLYWPQAKFPFGVATLKYIAALDAEADIALLHDHGWILSAECARVLRVGTMLLKKGAAAGLTAYEIGSMMCRETLNKKSLIEEMLEDAEGSVLSTSSEAAFMGALSAIMDNYIQTAVFRRAEGNNAVY